MTQEHWVDFKEEGKIWGHLSSFDSDNMRCKPKTCWTCRLEPKEGYLFNFYVFGQNISFTWLHAIGKYTK